MWHGRWVCVHALEFVALEAFGVILRDSSLRRCFDCGRVKVAGAASVAGSLRPTAVSPRAQHAVLKWHKNSPPFFCGANFHVSPL